MRIAPGGKRYVLAAATLALLGLFASPVLGGLLLGIGAFVAWFYRDPERRPPPAGVVAPADGEVSVVRVEDGRVRLGIYMGVADVHVNRAPLAGTVREIEHTPGAHRPAFSKESERNERLRVGFDDYELLLIAGAFARRITPYIEEGEAIERGERVGHIAFGSRVDVLLPPEVGIGDLYVLEGDGVRAGETVIAPEP